MKRLIQQLLKEYTLPQLRMPKNITPNEHQKAILARLTPSDIELIDKGNDGQSIVHMGVRIKDAPELEPGIIMDIQIIKDIFYHPHFAVSENMRGYGISEKMFIAFVKEFGNIYVSKGRMMNPNVTKILKKVGADSEIEYVENDMGVLLVGRNAGNREELLSAFGG